MIQVKNPQDVGAGILLVLIGAAGIYFGRELEFGSARNMGPGYFPTIVSGLIILIGAIVTLNALVVKGPAIERIQFRPLAFLILAIAAFGFLISQVGAVISSALLIVLAAFAQRKVNILETLVFAILAAVFVVVIFVYALGQPMPVWWWS